MSTAGTGSRWPLRPLGRTGHKVTPFALGGEGVLRTYGRTREAVEVIHAALDEGVNYCDTAPAYDGSLDYYGAALGERRGDVFLASKTHDRSRDGSLRLLDGSLRRLNACHWLIASTNTPLMSFGHFQLPCARRYCPMSRRRTG